MGHVLAAMMPENRLVMETCIATGLRASDVLNLRTERLRQRMTVRELKTGKTRRVYFPRELYLRLVGNEMCIRDRVQPCTNRSEGIQYNGIAGCNVCEASDSAIVDDSMQLWINPVSYTHLSSSLGKSA